MIYKMYDVCVYIYNICNKCILLVSPFGAGKVAMRVTNL